MDSIKGILGKALASYLETPRSGYIPFAVVSQDLLRKTLRPGDVLLVEGNTRVSAAIKYLTHSTWSHSAFYAGAQTLIEADLKNGVIEVPLAKYDAFNTRICRAVDLAPEDLAQIINHMRTSLGRTYDLKNIFDLMRYLLPQPPVPQRFRRRMLALGSGDPTRAICSTLIAEAFQSVRYPILPKIETDNSAAQLREIHHIRHHSLFTPRDFDLSPFFRVVKPTIENDFDFREIEWNDMSATTQPSEQIKAAQNS